MVAGSTPTTSVSSPRMRALSLRTLEDTVTPSVLAIASPADVESTALSESLSTDTT